MVTIPGGSPPIRVRTGHAEQPPPEGRTVSSIDFLQLYRELDLAAGATPDDLKRAYRRRVSELHPDRNGANTDAEARLRQLNSLYAAAMRFHLQHGRLPGSPTPATAAASAPAARRFEPSAGTKGEPATPPRRSSGRWLLLLAVLAGAAAFFLFPSDPATTPVRSPAAPPEGAADRRPPPMDAFALRPTTLMRGMTAEEVLELEGRPITRDEERWDYGASWIAFDRGKVSDWYSSPMQPLKRAARRPPPPETDAPLR